MVNIAGIFGIIMALVAVLVGVYWIYVWATWESISWGYYTGASIFWLIYSIVFIVFFVLGIMFFMQCKKINDMVDHGQYIQAKSKALVWMIIGILFVFFIPGILLLIAYLKFDDLIRATQPAYYPPTPQQPQYYQQQPQYQQQPPQQYPPQQQQPPQHHP